MLLLSQSPSGEAGPASVGSVVPTSETPDSALGRYRRRCCRQPGAEHPDAEGRGDKAAVTAADCTDRA